MKQVGIRWNEPNFNRARRSKKHEIRVADKLGGKRLPVSGAKPFSKYDQRRDFLFGCGGADPHGTACGDLSTKDFHVEHKRTECASMSIQREWLDKVEEGARKTGKNPAVVVTFEVDLQRPTDWVLIPMEVFERLRKKGTK